MQAKLGHHPSTGAEERSGIEGIEMSIVSSGLGMDGKEKPSNKSASKDVLTPSMGFGTAAAMASNIPVPALNMEVAPSPSPPKKPDDSDIFSESLPPAVRRQTGVIEQLSQN